MGTKNNPGTFDCYVKALPDEPLFVLLARDPAASDLVEAWARIRDGMIASGERPMSDAEMVREARACAEAMREWRETASPGRGAATFNRFEYRTPLNGGNGFTFDRETMLRPESSPGYSVGDRYLCAFDQIHNLAGVRPGTVIVLSQYVDIPAVGHPTHTYSRGKEPPALSGLYDKHRPDQIVARLRQLERLAPGALRRAGLDVLVREAA